MSDGMDFYDVKAMVEEEVLREKWSRNRHIEDVEKDLRREFRNEVMALREEVGELIAEVHNMIGAERVAAQDATNALRRAFDARTEHLV